MILTVRGRRLSRLQGSILQIAATAAQTPQPPPPTAPWYVTARPERQAVARAAQLAAWRATLGVAFYHDIEQTYYRDPGTFVFRGQTLWARLREAQRFVPKWGRAAIKRMYIQHGDLGWGTPGELDRARPGQEGRHGHSQAGDEQTVHDSLPSPYLPLPWTWALRPDTSSAIEALLDHIAELIATKLAAKLDRPEPVADRLLTAKEAAALLGLKSERWLYRNGKKLGFARQLGPGTVRFSEAAIKAFMARRP